MVDLGTRRPTKLNPLNHVRQGGELDLCILASLLEEWLLILVGFVVLRAGIDALALLLKRKKLLHKFFLVVPLLDVHAAELCDIDT